MGAATPLLVVRWAKVVARPKFNVAYVARTLSTGIIKIGEAILEASTGFGGGSIWWR